MGSLSFTTRLALLALVFCAAALSCVRPAAAGEYKPGETVGGVYVSTEHKPGVSFQYFLYVPKAYDPGTPAALYLCHDGLVQVHADVMAQLADSGQLPAVVCVGLIAGNLEATLPGGIGWHMRAEEYDQCGPQYADFVIDEFLPWLINEYGLNISPSPDMHLVGGASSGGISAWNLAWFRNDYFHRCYMSSPTFSSMRDGETPVFLARIAETRAIRCYELYGDFEPMIPAGDSFVAAVNAERMMDFCGYDYQCEHFPGEGHGCRWTDPEVARRAMQFLWKGWDQEPVRPLRNPLQIDDILTFGTGWEVTDEPMPVPPQARSAAGTFRAEGSDLYLTDEQGNERCVTPADADFSRLTSVAVSADLWRLYAADLDRRFVYMMPINPDGTLGHPFGQAPLRLSWDARQLGAVSMATDGQGRIYAATQMGIQVITPFGRVETLLTLPGDKPADAVAFGGAENNYLYAQSGDTVYRRVMKVHGRIPGAGPADPMPNGYNGYYRSERFSEK